MKRIEWDEEKNKILKKIRGVSFEEIEELIQNGNVIETINHPNKEKYPNQKIAYVSIKNYVYYVPYVVDKVKIFLKTIIPTRRGTKKYLLKNKKV